ncbi:DUF4232 domain-containing protein [Streptomyces luteolus]|uniref:DUF4232 domain-containing protein n=1 Tax=Streptomyces luteolus TaxID=3043615 RepID=A0ABT6SQX6_9ACTN|nr:DUF4232 domain-containing protein [Streptomyces sp. B-S-A12]MDI3417770.1 DUF4232 domain-containing protein [Streptomyces sp. B-S-A12]
MSGIRTSFASRPARPARTSRTSRARLVAAAASVVLAAFSMTACDSGTGVTDEGAASTASSATPGGDEPADHGATGGSTSGKPAPDATKPDATKPAPDADRSRDQAAPKAVTCEGSTTRTVASPLKRPVNRMLLTVTNTGGKPCSLYGYPAVQFGEAQSVPPAFEDSRPQAVVTLQPGASGYASIALSGTDGSSDGYTAKTLAVAFQGRSGNESVGEIAHPALPAKGVYVDNTIRVTYWQQEMKDAVSW